MKYYHVLAFGNAFDGITLHGVWENPEEAAEFAEMYSDGEWHLLNVIPTDEPSDILTELNNVKENTTTSETD